MLMIPDLGEEGVAPGDGVVVPGRGQAVWAPVATQEYQRRAGCKDMLKGTLPDKLCFQVTFAHVCGETATPTKFRRLLHIGEIKISVWFCLIIAVIQAGRHLRWLDQRES